MSTKFHNTGNIFQVHAFRNSLRPLDHIQATNHVLTGGGPSHWSNRLRVAWPNMPIYMHSFARYLPKGDLSQLRGLAVDMKRRSPSWPRIVVLYIKLSKGIDYHNYCICAQYIYIYISLAFAFGWAESCKKSLEGTFSSSLTSLMRESQVEWNSFKIRSTKFAIVAGVLRLRKLKQPYQIVKLCCPCTLTGGFYVWAILTEENDSHEPLWIARHHVKLADIEHWERIFATQGRVTSHFGVKNFTQIWRWSGCVYMLCTAAI